jgi:Flp pilus assembly protein TadG
MTMAPRSLLNDRRGSTALEFAIVGSPFILLLLFIVGGGMLLWAKSAMQIAAAQTARCVAIGSLDCTDRTAYATGVLQQWGVANILPSVVVSVQTGQTCSFTAGHYASVTLTAAAGPVGQVIPGMSNATMTSTACFPSGT